MLTGTVTPTILLPLLAVKPVRWTMTGLLRFISIWLSLSMTIPMRMNRPSFPIMTVVGGQFLQHENTQFVSHFRTVQLPRAYTAISDTTTSTARHHNHPNYIDLRAKCINRVFRTTTTQPEHIVVVPSTNTNRNVMTSLQLQSQCSMNERVVCVISSNIEVQVTSSIIVYALVIKNEGKITWTDATTAAGSSGSTTVFGSNYLCSGYVAVEHGGTFDMNLQTAMGWIYIMNNGAIHSTLRTRVFGAVGTPPTTTTTTTFQSPTIRIVGRSIKKTWSLLSQPFPIGSTTIRVLDHPTLDLGWNVGDRIAIAPTDDRAQGQAQSFTIQNINTDKSIVLDKASRSFHNASIITGRAPLDGGLPTRQYQSAEVINLSRNIIITGDDFTEIPCDPFLRETFPGFETSTQGCMCTATRKTCTVGLHMVHMIAGTSQVQNVRIEKCGQRGIEGKYCFHWHLMRDCPTCLAKNNAIELSVQRGLVVHGTHRSVVDSNVFYDVRGPVLYIEDGNELQNQLLRNVGICPWKFQEGGCTIAGTSNSQSDTGLNQAGIYLESPTNDIIGNRMANHFNGMFMNPTGGRGLVQSKVCPDHMPLGIWDSNTFHSNGRFGTYALNGNYPVKNTGSSIATNGETSSCRSFTSDGSDNGQRAIVSNNFDYGNAFVGHYEAGDIQYSGHTSVQNLNLIYWKETKSFADGCSAHITDSYFWKGNMALPDSLGSFIIEHTTLDDVQLEANHHGNIGVTGFLCMPHYILHNITWLAGRNRNQWVTFTQSNEAGSGGIFSLSPQDAVLNIRGSGGYFLPRGYQSLVSSVYPYLLHIGNECVTSNSISLGIRYANGILCTSPLRAIKIYARNTAGDLRVRVWQRNNIFATSPIAEQTIPFFVSNDYVKGYKFPVIPGPNYLYRISLANGNNIPSDWLIDFSDQTISNRWGIDTLYAEIQGRTCSNGIIQSNHDRKYMTTNAREMLQVGVGWRRGACTEFPSMPTVKCPNTPTPATPSVVVVPTSTQTPIRSPVAAPVLPVPVVPKSVPILIPTPKSVPFAQPTPPNNNNGFVEFKLIDATTNLEAQSIYNGTVVQQSNYPHGRFNVVALVLPRSIIRSVRFSNGQAETAQPFSYCGDDGNGIYNHCPDLVAGKTYILSVTPFTGTYQQGSQLPVISVSFRIS